MYNIINSLVELRNKKTKKLVISGIVENQDFESITINEKKYIVKKYLIQFIIN
jgi:hypothetical protein